MTSIILKKHATQALEAQSLREINIKTPRTQQACQQLGIDPSDLEIKQEKDFGDENIHPELRKMRYENYLKQLKNDRKKVLKYKLANFDPSMKIKISIGDRALMGIQSTRELVKSNKLEKSYSALTPHEIYLTQSTVLRDDTYKQKREFELILQKQQFKKENDQRTLWKENKIKQAEQRKEQELKKKVESQMEKSKKIQLKVQQLQQENLNYQKKLAQKMKNQLKEVQEREQKLNQEKRRILQQRENIARFKREEIIKHRQDIEQIEQQKVSQMLTYFEKKFEESDNLKSQKLHETQSKAISQMQHISPNNKKQLEVILEEQNRQLLEKILEKQKKAHSNREEIENKIKQQLQES